MAGVTGVTLAEDRPAGTAVVSYAAVPGTRWGLVLEEPWGVLAGGNHVYAGLLTVLLVLSLLLPAAVVALGLRQVVGLIRYLTDAVREVADGDLDQQVQVETGDEIETLADGFNRIAGELQRSYSTLEQRVADRTRELATLNTISAAIGRSLAMDEVIETALSATIEALRMDGGAAYLPDKASGELHLAAQRSLSPELQAVVDVLAPGAGASGTGVQRGEVVTLAVEDYPGGDLRAALEREGFRQVTGVPMASGGRVLGSLSLVRRASLPLGAEEERLLASVAAQIGVAVENAELYREAEQPAAQPGPVGALAPDGLCHGCLRGPGDGADRRHASLAIAGRPGGGGLAGARVVGLPVQLGQQERDAARPSGAGAPGLDTLCHWAATLALTRHPVLG